MPIKKGSKKPWIEVNLPADQRDLLKANWNVPQQIRDLIDSVNFEAPNAIITGKFQRLREEWFIFWHPAGRPPTQKAELDRKRS